MIKELINYLLDIAYKHKSVGFVSYIKELNINDQKNEKSFQFFVTDNCLLEKQIVDGILTLKMGVYVIGFVGSDTSTLDIQDEAAHIVFDIIEYVNNNNYQLNVRDYSIASLSEYSDNNCSGVYCTLQFTISNPINLCEYEEHFEEKPTPVIPTLDLKNGDPCTEEKFVTKGTTLKLKPIKLK